MRQPATYSYLTKTRRQLAIAAYKVQRSRALRMGEPGRTVALSVLGAFSASEIETMTANLKDALDKLEASQ